MNSVNFFKKTGDDWVYLAQSEEDEDEIKVFYDDQTIKTSKGMAEVYQEYMKQVNAENSTTTLNSMWSVGLGIRN